MALIYKVGPCGGGNGEERDMGILGVSRINKVAVRHGDTIDGLSVTFERDGSVETTGLWGKPGGDLTEIVLRPDEYIISINGYLGHYRKIHCIRSLTLVTSLGTYGPFGQEQGSPFGLPAIGGKIIGFYGRSDKYLIAIGAYVKVESLEENYFKVKENPEEKVEDSSVQSSSAILLPICDENGTEQN